MPNGDLHWDNSWNYLEYSAIAGYFSFTNATVEGWVMPVTFFFSNVYQSNVKQRPFAKGDILPSFLALIFQRLLSTPSICGRPMTEEWKEQYGECNFISWGKLFNQSLCSFQFMEQHMTLNQEDDGNKFKICNWRGRLSCPILPIVLTTNLPALRTYSSIIKKMSWNALIFQTIVKNTTYKAKQSQRQQKNISCEF